MFLISFEMIEPSIVFPQIVSVQFLRQLLGTCQKKNDDLAIQYEDCPTMELLKQLKLPGLECFKKSMKHIVSSQNSLQEAA